MYIKQLTVKNFRNYGSLCMEFSPGINFITGENGTGKTNILEAISVVSNIKSFRGIADSEIIQWGHDSYFCSILGEEGEYHKFEIGCGHADGKLKKKIKLNSKEVSGSSKYFGKLLTVIFSPIDINIINGAPEMRRKFFDSAISKIDNDYMVTLNEFKKVLASRNKLLKMIKERTTNGLKQLDIWDRLFVEKSSLITGKRLVFLEQFKDLFSATYSGIAPEDGVEIVPGISYLSSSGSAEPGDLEELLRKNRDKEIIIGSTQTVQRDDYLFRNIKNNDFINYASQGQRRTAAIALKISENSIIEEKRKEKTVILVDDIFSELDEKRRKNMVNILRQGNQVIFTMVNSNSVNPDDFGSYKCFSVKKNGFVEETVSIKKV